jgi:hypothetical protein
VKRPGREVDHSPPRSAKVKNAWSYTSTLPYVFRRRRDSSVGKALCTGQTTGVELPAMAKNFSLRHRVQARSGTHQASYPMGTRSFSPGVKRPGREDDHSLYCSAEVKNGWSYTSTRHRLDDGGAGVRFPAGTGNFSLHHRIQNGSGAHPASYPMGTRGSFPEGKVAWA